MDHYSYKDTLENCLKQLDTLFYEKSENWIFQQHSAAAHTAHSIQDWFNKIGYKVNPWCARSPDLNSIEHI